MSYPALKSKIIASGRPLVLLHAFPFSNEIWEGLRPPPGFRVILPNFPGFGSSPAADPGLSLADVAWGLEKHLEETGVTEPIVLGGISMGGYWALEFLRHFPNRITGLILISTRAGIDGPEARQKRIEMAKRVELEGTGFLVNAMIPGLLGKTTRDQGVGIVKAVSGQIAKASPLGVALAQMAMANRRDQNDLLPMVKVKSLVVAGLEDALIPFSEAESLAKSIPGAQLRLIPEAGHLIPIEAPEIFQNLLNDFLI